jgi:hypothetical protein
MLIPETRTSSKTVKRCNEFVRARGETTGQTETFGVSVGTVPARCVSEDIASGGWN